MWCLFVFVGTREFTIHDATVAARQQLNMPAMRPESALLDRVVAAGDLDEGAGTTVREIDAGEGDVLAVQAKTVRHVRPEPALRPDDDRLAGRSARGDRQLVAAERTAVAEDDHVTGARIADGAGELRIVRDIDVPALCQGVADQSGVAGQKRQRCCTQEQVAPGQC